MSAYISKNLDVFPGMHPVRLKQAKSRVITTIYNVREKAEQNLRRKIAALYAKYKNKMWGRMSHSKSRITLDKLNSKLAELRQSFSGQISDILYKDSTGYWKLSPPLMLDGNYKLVNINGKRKLGYVRDFENHKTPEGGYSFIRGINGILRVLPAEISGTVLFTNHIGVSRQADYVLSGGEVVFRAGQLDWWTDKTGAYRDVHLHKQAGPDFPKERLRCEVADKSIAQSERAIKNWKNAKNLALQDARTAKIKQFKRIFHHRRKSSGHHRSDAEVYFTKFFQICRNAAVYCDKNVDIDGLPISGIGLSNSPCWKQMHKLQQKLHMNGPKFMQVLRVR